MPARNKKAEAATKVWEKRKGKRLNSNRPRKLKKWSNESMLLAINAVRDGTMSSNMAARTFDVPPSTLKDRISGRVKHGTKSGPIPYLDEAEEKELVDFLIKSAAMGYGKTKREVFSILERTLKKKGKFHDHFNGEGWWIRFMIRHPKLSLRCTDSLSRVRVKAVTKENMDNYFLLLKQTLTDNNLLDKPSYIYNMDETGMPLDHKQPKQQEMKRVEKQRRKEKEKNTGFKKTFVTRSKTKNGYRPQNEESTSNECTVCFGEYKDDLSPGGVPLKNWVQCTSEECKKWMHEDCACKNSDDNLVCACGNVFI